MNPGSLRYLDSKDLFQIFSYPFRSNQISAFESEAARYVGTRYALGTSFGRTSLLSGLLAMQVEGKEVILPSFICTVVRHAVTLAGATPRFVDINPNHFVYDMRRLRENLTKKTAAIVLVHYFGRVARNMDDVLDLSFKSGIPIIEDCSHSLGASYNDRRIGTFGRFSIFSLTKNTLNFGGGFLATDDEDLYRRARRVVDKETCSFLNRVSQLPKIAAYGLEQGINKLIFDRFRRHPLKYWGLVFPRTILMLRYFSLKGKFQAKMILRPPKAGTDGNFDREIENHGPAMPRPTIAMWPVIASLGRSQLYKLDELNRRRCSLFERLLALPNALTSRTAGMGDVCTHLVLRFPNTDIFQTVLAMKKKGILLRPTWPTHQRLWPHQNTKNVLRIRDSVLTYDVNPMLTNREVDRFRKLVAEYYP